MADETRPPEPHADASDDSFEPPRPALGRITRVRLKNYKSIVSCDVQLEPLTLLVGPNGSGKSNFLDALAFVSEALTVGLDQAIRNRGNLDRILSASRAPDDDSVSIKLDFELPDGSAETYDFTVQSDADYGFALSQRTEQTPLPRPVYDLLRSMVFYNPQPDAMRGPKERDLWPHLRADGSNVASILRRIFAADPELAWRIETYMSRVLPGLEGIIVDDLAGYDLLRLTMSAEEGAAPYSFVSSQLSDGTLRALAILVALFQGRLGGKSATSLVGIEEPENTLHPATGGAFADALTDASYDGQVLVTTHSMSLLDGEEIDVRCLRAVVSEHGRTMIGPVDAVSVSIIRDHLFTAAELLQQGQLQPELVADGESGAPVASEPTPAGR